MFKYLTVALTVLIVTACSFVVKDTRTPEEIAHYTEVHATQTAEAETALLPTVTPEAPPIPTIEPEVLPEPCVVKGNVTSKGEKIFHVEGQANYRTVIIDPDHGERCFDTEEDAVAAGWRKSLR